LAPYLRNERSYRLAVFCIVSASTRRFERAQARPGRCTRCSATLRTPGFHPLQSIRPLPRATLDFSGYELDYWDPVNDPLRLAPLSRPQVRSLLRDPPCPPPPHLDHSSRCIIPSGSFGEFNTSFESLQRELSNEPRRDPGGARVVPQRFGHWVSTPSSSFGLSLGLCSTSRATNWITGIPSTICFV